MAVASTIHFALLALSIFLQHTSTLATEKSYIVYLGTHPHGLNPTDADAEVATKLHYDLLGSVLGSYEKVHESVVYSYNKYINGFAAKLTADEAERMKSSPNVVSLLENQRLQLHTTHSWEFLGLEQNGVTPTDSLWNISGYGDGVIIGTFDTGVWPESESFNDQDLGPIPSKWKGACMTGSDPTFKCNSKLIGARYFHKGHSSLSPRDTEGHGSHTLSTVGGSFVKGANTFRFGSGVAKGGSPKARLAAYKVCWPEGIDGGCMTADILAAFETAIGDGVDVLSLSLGADALDYKQDGMAIGSFHAVRHGITVVASAGNDGPEASSVGNIAPWIFTIGASTIDRAFANRVILENSTLRFKGSNVGASRLLPRRHFHPLIDAASASAPANSSTSADSRYCLEGTLDPSKVKGKIVVCQRGGGDRVSKGRVVQAAGGVAMILLNGAGNGNVVEADAHVLPASQLSYKDGLSVLEYINKTANPTAYITNGKTQVGIKPAPIMAPFSSRGPSSIYPQILKPDITAPGVNVLAAFTGAAGASGFEFDTRRVNYTVMSGTSMSCPHVSGIVGLLKSLHPDWSPAAIRSALMTTATTFDNEDKTITDPNETPATPFGYGAGHINPNAAANPGLIYNLTENDYLDFLCSFYTEKDLKVFTPTPYKCKNSKSILDFNYPSITVTNFTTLASLKRSVTNVGNPGTYKVTVSDPSGVSISVVPSSLTFNQTGETHTFSVELKAISEKPRRPGYVFGSLVWSDGTHNVRSPIVVEKAKI